MTAAAVGLVAEQRVWSSTCPAGTQSRDLQCCQQNREHRAVVGLARSGVDHQRPPAPIDERMELGGQASTGATDRMINRLRRQILVIRPPLCGSGGSSQPPSPRRRVLMNPSRGAVDTHLPMNLADRIGPGPAAAAGSGSQTPRLDSCECRCQTARHGPYRSGTSRPGQPVRKRKMIASISGRWSRKGLLRLPFVLGMSGSISAH